MRVVVTGGTGSVGRSIVRAAVAAGHEVVVVTRHPGTVDLGGATPCRGDVALPDTLDRAFARADVVVHGAAAVGRSAAPADHARVTVGGTRNALIAAARAGARRFVHLSSLAVHAPAPVIREDSRLWRGAPYAYCRAKLAAEDLVSEGALAHGFETVTLRPGLVLGPGDRHVTPRLVALLERRLGTIVGTGSNRVPCLTTGDLAAATLAAIERPGASGPYVLAGTTAVTQADLWRMHARAAGLGEPRLAAPARLARGLAALLEASARALGRVPLLTPFEVLAMSADVRVETSRAAGELDWRGAGSIENAVAEAVASLPGRSSDDPTARERRAPPEVRCAS